MSAGDLTSILDLHDRLVASCVGLVPDGVVEREAEVGRSARRRAGYLADTVVVALVGGTGSGKSSLLNALAGEEVSPAGSVRPTTAEPLAWIPSNPEPGLVRLLDDLGIERRVGHDRPEPLAVVDLPDTDSVVFEHRRTVERLVPLVDAVIWVLDPEKYKDDRLHRELIRPLAAHSSRFVFALNQVDRLQDDELPLVVDDLRSALVDDGVDSPNVVLTAGDPPFSDPHGLDELLASIHALGSARLLVTRRVVTQLKESGDRLVATLGGVGGTGFVPRWTAARNETADRLADAVEAALADAAVLTARRDAATVTSWIGGRSPASSFTAPGAPIPVSATAPIRSLVDETGRMLDPAGRARLIEDGPDPDHEVIAVGGELAATEEVVLDDPPTWWSGIRLLSYLLVGVIILGVGMTIDGARSDTAVAPGVALVMAGVAGIAAVRIVVGRSARRRVDRAMIARRTAERASAELERRIGRPLRQILRERSAPGAMHAELVLAISRFEET